MVNGVEALAEPGSSVVPGPATGAFVLIGVTVLLPLVGAALLLVCGRRTDRWGHLLATALSGASFVVSLVLFVAMLGRDTAGRSVEQHLFSWVPVASFQVDIGFRLDQLSMVFLLLVTGVGTLIHVYSIGYMAHDENRRRFFAYLNLFVAAMLLLVLAENFLLLYAGWEGVGLASYLLIGFWQHKPSAATAAKKAFIVNRVGDLGLLIAVFLMFSTFGGVSFTTVFGSAHLANQSTLTAIGLLLLLGACGKSAQFPLQTWLLDAMEGPTPVSALIHAATMVTAGVYLITRSGPIFNLTPDAQLLVTIVGAVTILLGAIIGCAKDDIKKALAASTMSQIGYMILAAGLGPIGYVFAILHLLTHGFFKAGLFLGAGSVMHAMGDETDMRRFGGLRTKMPITYVTFGLGFLAIIGFPGLSGFWSKDKIIEASFAKGGTSGMVLGIVAVLAAGITAFYMSRVMFMTFFGRPRWDEQPPAATGSGPSDSDAPASHHPQHVEPHESPAVMTVPMIILALGSVLAGGLLSINSAFLNWLSPVTGHEEGHPVNTGLLTGVTLAVVAVGVLLAYLLYLQREVPVAAPKGSLATRAARRDMFGDTLNEALLMVPGQYLTRLLVFVDNKRIDGVVNGVAALVVGTSGRLRRLQTGYVRTYALSMAGGAAVLIAAILLVRAS